MWKIKLTTVNGNMTHEEIIMQETEFGTRKDALLEMYKCAIDELNGLNGEDFEIGTARTEMFFCKSSLNGHDIVIQKWMDNEDKTDVITKDIVYYDVVSIFEERTKEWNEKLKEYYGKSFEIEIHFDEEDNEYYWQSNYSDAGDGGFGTSEEAFESIKRYMNYLELAYGF